MKISSTRVILLTLCLAARLWAAPSGAKLYQVRAVRLQVTGSGCYTNLSQGVFANVN
jgi:hypothetical protein